MKVCDQVSRDAHALKCGLAVEVLHSSGTLHLRVMGWSMLPTVWPGDTLIVERLASNEVFDGDIVLFSNGRRFVAHRVVDGKRRAGKPDIQTKGDAVPRLDSPVPGGNLLGKVSFIVRNGKRIPPRKSLRFSERAVAAVFRRSPLAARVFVGVHGLRQTSQGPSQIQTP